MFHSLGENPPRPLSRCHRQLDLSEADADPNRGGDVIVKVLVVRNVDLLERESSGNGVRGAGGPTGARHGERAG